MIMMYILLLCFSILGTSGQDGLPTITKHPSSMLVPKNEAVLLECEVEGEGEPRVEWFHNGNRVSAGSDMVVLPTGSLFILRATYDNMGMYWCRVWNEVGMIISNEATLQVGAIEDNFVLEPENTQVALGDNAVLSCIPPEGHPTPEVSWYKEGEALDLSESGRIYLEGGHNLTFRHVDAEDEGIYVCQAENRFGVRQSHPATLRVHWIRKLFRLEPKNTVVDQGDNALLHCIPPEGHPDPKVSWYKESESLDLNQSGRVLLVDGYNLMVSSAQPEDEGTYQCRAENQIAVRLSRQVTLRVHSSECGDISCDHSETCVKSLNCSSEGCLMGVACVALHDSDDSNGEECGDVFCTVDERCELMYQCIQSHCKSYDACLSNNADRNWKECGHQTCNHDAPCEMIHECLQSECSSSKTCVPNKSAVPEVIVHFGLSSNDDDVQAHFECTFFSYSSFPEVTWKHDGNVLSNDPLEGILITNQSMVLQRLRSQQPGIYQCSVEDKMSAPINLNIQVTAVENAELCGSVYCNEDEECERVYQCEEPDCVIDNVCLPKESYTCKNTSCDGCKMVYLRSCGLRPCQPGPYCPEGIPDVLIRLGHFVKPDIKEGDDIYFECIVTSSPLPVQHVSWKYNGSILSQDRSKGIFISSNSLVLQALERHQVGIYQCQAENIIGYGSSQPFLLNMQYRPEVQVVLGQRIYLDNIKAGVDIYFDCVVSSNPTATKITWFFEDNILEEDTSRGIRYWNSSLVIQNVEKENSGQYTCSAENNLGIGVSPEPIHVNILYAPEALVRLEGDRNIDDISVNDTVSFECVISADPEWRAVTWLHNIDRIFPDPSNGILIESNSLVLHSIQKEQEGRYRCVAENEIGMGYSEPFHLYVGSAPEVEIRLGESVNVSDVTVGDDVYFECLIRPKLPTTIVTWMHNGLILNHDIRNGIIMFNQTLVVQRLDRDQAGLYECSAENNGRIGYSEAIDLTVQRETAAVVH